MDYKGDFLKFILKCQPEDFSGIKMITCSDVIDALWPWRTAKAHTYEHQTRIILSQLPAAIMVFS